jgi:hypothetical protein
MQNGQLKGVLFVDGWKIGMITKLLYATGISIIYRIFIASLCYWVLKSKFAWR